MRPVRVRSAAAATRLTAVAVPGRSLRRVVGLGGTSPPPGSSTTLLASANVDVGPTPYGISIFDTTAGAELVHAGTGSSLAASVSRVAAATHSYVAKICNPGGVNAQASSVTVSVTWS